MSEFVGRTGSMRVYSYPEGPRGGGSSPEFARNYATGPKSLTVPAEGVEIPWQAVDAGDPPTDVDVPITPAVTGIVLVSGVVNAQNNTGAPILMTVTVRVGEDDISVPILQITIAVGAIVVIPFLAETSPATTPIGSTRNIRVFVSAEGATLLTDGSAVEVQEVSVATG